MELIFSSLIDIGILLLLSAFFSGAESSLMSLRASQIARMAHGSGVDRVIHTLMQDTRRLISVILVGNMFVNVLLTALCGSLLAYICMGTDEVPGLFDITAAPLLRMCGMLQDPASVDAAAGVFSALMNIAIVTPLLMIFGELSPKTVAIVKGVSFARAVALPIRFLSKVLFPAVWCLEKVCGRIQRLMGIDEKESLLDRSEISATLAGGAKSGSASDSERRMLEDLMRLGTLTAADLMTPADRVAMLDDSLSVREAFEAARTVPERFLPVRDEGGRVWAALRFSDYPRWIDGPQAGAALASFRGKLEAAAAAGGSGSASVPLCRVLHAAPGDHCQEVWMNEDMHDAALCIVEDEGRAIGVVSMQAFIRRTFLEQSPKQGGAA